MKKELESRNLDLIKIARDDDFKAWNSVRAGLHSNNPEVAAENKV